LKSSLAIRPLFDEVTSYSYSWCEEVIGWLRNAGYEVTDLAKDRATRIEVENAIKAGNPSLIVFYDHGNRYGLAEQGGEGYVIDKKNDILLKNREIYTLACLWGSDGGIDAWKKGAKAVWCYTKEFAFSTDALTEFGRFANEGLRLRLEGKSWAECLRMAKELARELASRLVEAGKYIAAVLLSRDAEILVCYTPENPPESRCPLRRALIKLFGPRIGWSLPRILF
jgi:hypothetical protein